MPELDKFVSSNSAFVLENEELSCSKWVCFAWDANQKWQEGLNRVKVRKHMKCIVMQAAHQWDSCLPQPDWVKPLSSQHNGNPLEMMNVSSQGLAVCPSSFLTHFKPHYSETWSEMFSENYESKWF